jgi:hypothetical protein
MSDGQLAIVAACIVVPLLFGLMVAVFSFPEDFEDP